MVCASACSSGRPAPDARLRRGAGALVPDRKETNRYSWDRLPPVAFQPAGPLSTAISARGITDFQAAGRYLHALPYGRTADRADFRAVLREGKGTCSTKHALLAALAHEQALPVVLMLGIYAMHERNTPGVGAVLARSGLVSLPEAHCYLMYAGLRIDVTRSGADPTEPSSQFLHEEAIAPAQIGAYKVTLHRHWLQDWVSNHREVLKGLDFEDVWRIREACIAALAQ